MQTRISLIALLSAAVFATSAGAESVSSGGLPDYANLRFNYVKQGSFDLLNLGGAADFRAGPLQFTIDGQTYSFDGGNDVHALTAKAAYGFADGFAAYLQATYLELNSFDETIFGIGADYQNEVFGAGLQYQSFRNNDFFHLTGYYRFNPKFQQGGTTALAAVSFLEDEEVFTLGADHRNERFRLTGFTALSSDSFQDFTALGGHYYVTPQLGVGANVVTFNDALFDDGIYSLDVGYRFIDNVTLSAFYASEFGNSFGNTDFFGINLTWELGRDRARVFDRVDMYLRDAVGPIGTLRARDAFTQVTGPGRFGLF
ncbi:hypothetical protein [Aliiroseovarius sp.]|uniref:hypothetical protein n=1 Tax=Aliiroseovarius sp. TaxID=1872442 RepID=UPI003BAA1C09